MAFFKRDFIGRENLIQNFKMQCDNFRQLRNFDAKMA